MIEIKNEKSNLSSPFGGQGAAKAPSLREGEK